MEKREQIRKAEEKQQARAWWWHTIHGSRFGFFYRLIFVGELCPCHPVLRLFLFQTLLQSLQFVVQVNFQVVLFLWGAATGRFTFRKTAEAFRHTSGCSCLPSPNYCSSPGLVCVLPPLWTGWASGFCCPLVNQPSLLRTARQKNTLFDFQEIKSLSLHSAVSTFSFIFGKENLCCSHLEAPWSPQIPGCSSSSLSRGCFESAGPPSPAGPFLHLWRGSSPAAPGSSSPTGSSTWPFPCGFSVILRPCPTRHAGGRWPLPTAVRQREKRTHSFIQTLLLLIWTVDMSLLGTCFCSWIILSFEACEFWLIFFISSSCSFKVDTRNVHWKCTRARFQIIWQLNEHLSKPEICCKYESQTFKQQI